MQSDTGKVIGLNGQMVLVRLDAHDGCTSCPIVQLCTNGIRGPSTVSVRSTISVSPGDTVEVVINDGVMLRAALVAYGVPLAGFLLGIFSGYYALRVMAGMAAYASISSLGTGFLMLIPSALVARRAALRTSFSGSVARVIMEVVA